MAPAKVRDVHQCGKWITVPCNPPYSPVPPSLLFTGMDWKHYAGCRSTPLLSLSAWSLNVRVVISWRESTGTAGLSYFLFTLSLLPILFLCAARLPCLILEAGGLWITLPLSCTHMLTYKPPPDTVLYLLCLAQDCWIEFASSPHTCLLK